jgi:hypothetical protein
MTLAERLRYAYIHLRGQNKMERAGLHQGVLEWRPVDLPWRPWLYLVSEMVIMENCDGESLVGVSV